MFVFITLPTSVLSGGQTVNEDHKLAHDSSATEHLCFIIQFTLF